MALMRSEIKSGGGDWLGIKNATLQSVRDESDKYDWADIYLVCEFEVKGSKYPRPLKIAGSFEKNDDGTIQDCSLLRRITYFFDAIGEPGCVNQHGEWCNEKEEKISDICDHLTKNYKGTLLTVYVYRELAKNGQAYTKIHNKVLAHGNGSETELQSYIDFLKSKGFIKEAPADHKNAESTPDSSTPSEFDIANL